MGKTKKACRAQIVVLQAIFQPTSVYGWTSSNLVGQIYCAFLMGSHYQSVTISKKSKFKHDMYVFWALGLTIHICISSTMHSGRSCVFYLLLLYIHVMRDWTSRPGHINVYALHWCGQVWLPVHWDSHPYLQASFLLFDSFMYNAHLVFL